MTKLTSSEVKEMEGWFRLRPWESAEEKRKEWEKCIKVDEFMHSTEEIGKRWQEFIMRPRLQKFTSREEREVEIERFMKSEEAKG